MGTICGGSDATSGLTANPAVGRAFDLLVDQRCDGHLRGNRRADRLRAAHGRPRGNARSWPGNWPPRGQGRALSPRLGHGSFAPGNAEGGLTTIEEKSLGAYAKSGSRPISGLLKPGDRPPRGGLYLLDVVPDGEVRFGFPNICDNAEIVELMACGCHLMLFTTGRGSVVGSAIAPVIKVCANPETYRRMAGRHGHRRRPRSSRAAPRWTKWPAS